jgi:PAS domain S-box-containing protein
MRKKRADATASGARGRRPPPAKRRPSPKLPKDPPRARQHDNELEKEILELRERQSDHEHPSDRYADLFDFAPIAYVLLDSVGLILRMNLAACRLLDAERAKLLGRPLLSFVLEQDRSELLEHLRRCRTGKGAVESEVRFSSSDGRAVTCRVYSERATYEGREALPTVIIDQTDRLALDEARLVAERLRDRAERDKQAAESASAAKDRFLARVSHELRTPLTPALVAAGSLVARESLPESARELASTIQRNIQVEARLIDDLLDVARIDRDRLDLQLATIDLHEIAQEAIEICRAVARANSVDVQVRFVADSHHVRGDRDRLRQVFWNLLSNAIKFTEAGGRVAVSTSNADDAMVRFTVRDSGAGMDPETVEDLFAPFHPHRDEHRSRRGLGLGLAICKGIVRAHGGQLWAASDGPGQGSTFAVELETTDESSEQVEDSDATVESRAAGPDAKATAAPDERRPESSRILIVEDDADSGAMLALFLRSRGYTVEIAPSLAHGLRRLEEGWDVVLSDLGLPDGSGLEVAKRARALPHPPPRLIAFTGYGFDDHVNASREAGFDDHLVKPVDLQTLLNALRGVAPRRAGS